MFTYKLRTWHVMARYRTTGLSPKSSISGTLFPYSVRHGMHDAHCSHMGMHRNNPMREAFLVNIYLNLYIYI